MSHEEKDYIQILRSHGYRVTQQRLIVLDAVCDIGGHATINRIGARVKEHHLVCQSCGKILTISIEELNPLLEHLQAQYGFTVRADHLSPPGYCRDCGQ